MSYNPDYGLLMLKNYVEPDATISFYSFKLDHISSTAPQEFTTMVEILVEGCLHAASFDFDIQILADIIALCPNVDTISEISDWYDELTGPNTLELVQPFEFGLEAKLGELQGNNEEQYVPLVIQRVFKVGA